MRLLKALTIRSRQYKHTIDTAYMGNNLADDTLVKIAHNLGTQPAQGPEMTEGTCIHRMC